MGLLSKAIEYRESKEYYAGQLRNHRIRHESDPDSRLCNYAKPRQEQSRRNRDYLSAIYAMLYAAGEIEREPKAVKELHPEPSEFLRDNLDFKSPSREEGELFELL